ncbi:retrovirus-related pol polyprotein from transposon RE1 [Tanacetum coccineum]
MAGDEPKKGVTDDASSSQQRKLISPFDITTLDNPGLVITQVQLKGDNYDEWSRSFRTAIRARKKFGFIDGTIERPGEKDKDIEDWWTINSLLVSWIRNTIEPSLCSTISHVEIAKDLWDDIKDHFFVTNGPRIQQLKSDLAGWKCVCNLGAVFEKKQEEEKVHTFLMSLDESVYGTARSNILAQDPLPNLNKVYSILIQEERVNTMVRGKDERPELMALAMQNRTEAKNRSVICTECMKTGHNAEKCFEIHGYPEWWGDRPRVDTKRNGAGRGLSSGRGKGRGGRGLETMNGKFSWIIDSGASHHMTGLIEKLTNIKEIDRILRTVIGAGKRWDGGLFYFREKPLVQALNTTLSISVDLWHKRLGHPPLEVINFLPGVSSSRKDKVISENCEMLTTLSLMFTMMRHIMEPLHKKGGDPLRTGEGSKFVPQDNIPSSSQSPVKETTESPHEEELGRGCRKKEASVHLRDFVTHTIRKASPFPSSSPAQSWSSVKDKRWCDAMDNELQALERNGTWTIENLPKDKKALGCKWVYKIKRKSDGTVERFKARLVILGNHQVAGIDYNETFAQVAKMVTVRVLLAVAAAKKWELHQMDVHNAFLRGDLNEEVFMKLPPGLSVNHPGQAYRLKKSLYGLRQAPHLVYSVHILSQFMQNPQVEHWEAAIRVVRFLKGSPGQGIFLKSMCDLQLRGWCDADSAGCPLTRRSLTGWAVYLGDSPTSWKTKKQHIVSRSSADAEYRSMAITTCELKWLKSVLLSLGIHQVKPMSLYCDSQAALHISQNPVFHEYNRADFKQMKMLGKRIRSISRYTFDYF